LKILGDIRKSRSTTSINNVGGKFATGINITFGTDGKFTTVFRCNWWQIMGIISDCLHIEVNLKKKITYMLTLLFKGIQTKHLKLSDLRLFHLPLVSTTPVVHLEQRISPRIFKKI
jgi:hypothetical protein